MATVSFGDITPTQAAYSSKQLLERALPFLVLEQLGNLKPLPAHSTKTIDFRRHKLPVPTDHTGFVLAEGVTPTSATPTMESFPLTLDQYGNVLVTTDVVDDTHIDDVLSEYMGMLGENAGQVIELMRWEEIRTASGVNTIYTGAVAGDSTVATAFGLSELSQAVRSLRGNYARPFTKVIRSTAAYETRNIEPSFVAVCHTDLRGSIRQQFGDKFTPVAEYGSTASILEGEFGNVDDVRFVSSALIGKRSSAGGAAATHTTLLSDDLTNVNLYDVCVMSADAWCGVALKGEFAVVPSLVKAKPSESDPLGQRSKAGYKTMQGCVVTQAAHIKRIVTGALKAY